MSTNYDPQKIIVEWKGSSDGKGAWKSSCPELDLETEADSIEEAIESIAAVTDDDRFGPPLEPLNGDPVG